MNIQSGGGPPTVQLSAQAQSTRAGVCQSPRPPVICPGCAPAPPCAVTTTDEACGAREEGFSIWQPGAGRSTHPRLRFITRRRLAGLLSPVLPCPWVRAYPSLSSLFSSSHGSGSSEPLLASCFVAVPMMIATLTGSSYDLPCLIWIRI